MAITRDSTATRTFTVGDDDTAVAVGSGDVPVLGTPRLLAWCEAVTVVALADQLADGETSVGYRIALNHRAPTAVGRSVAITATVLDLDGRQVTLNVVATSVEADGHRQEVEPTAEVYAEGTITRVVVDRDRFISRFD